MFDRIRIIKHEAVPDCGSFEVQLPDRPSQYFYWDDIPARRAQAYLGNPHVRFSVRTGRSNAIDRNPALLGNQR